MSTTSPPDIDNPSVGALSRLPAEIRNQIYDLSINTDDEAEVDFHKPCHRRYNLCLASKQIHSESKYFLAAVRNRRCPHINYRVTLPRDYPDLYPKHNIVQAHTIRFITGHLAGQAPLAVTLNLRELDRPVCEVFGASKERTRHLLRRVEQQMRVLGLSLDGEVNVKIRALEILAGTIIKASLGFCAERTILVVSKGKGRVSGRIDVL